VAQKEPAGQTEQRVEPVASLKKPAGQMVHSVEPSTGLK
jgi:hypothetical protein